MMKKIPFLLIVLLSCASAIAQDTWLRWAKQFAGISPLYYGRGLDVEVDADGNVYSVGIFTGTVDFDPGPAAYNLTPISTDVYISSLDAYGNFLWARQITGSFGTLTRSFSLDKDFNLCITGTFQGTVDFDPGPGIFNLTSNGTADIFVLKLTKNGDLVWAKHIGAAMADVEPYSTTTDSFGNIYFSGSYKGTVDFDPGPAVFSLTSNAGFFRDAFICRVDAGGNFFWAGSVGAAGQDIAMSLSADNFDNIYVTGFFHQIADFDPGPPVLNLTSNGAEDMFILKMDASCNFVWAKSIGGTGSEQMYKVNTDEWGNTYATGYFSNTVDFDPGAGIYNLSAPGAEAIFIMKLDDNGNFLWARVMGGPGFNNAGTDIDVDRLGNVYTTGHFTGPADFDPGPGIFILSSTAIDAFFSKLDNNGGFLWAKSAGAAAMDQGNGIEIDRFLNIYVTGQFGATVDFDLEASSFLLTAITSTDPFVCKIAQCEATTYSIVTEAACNAYTLNGQTYTSSGTYEQTIYNSAGCDSIITLHLTILPKEFTTVNVTICPGQSYYAGGANQTTAGIYKDTLLTSLGCDSVVTTNLRLYPKPDPDLGTDGRICTAAPTILAPGLFSAYLWQDNTTQSTFTVNMPGKYWVTVTDANSCSATDTLNILSIDTIPRNFLPSDQELCYGNILKITVPNYSTYQWNTGSTADNIDITNFGNYYLTVKDFNSCVGTDSITITRNNCIYIGIPNAFTPNGDTRNDIFKPTIFQAVVTFSFVVFNRYGQKVFETTEYGKGWDGSFKGNPQPSGTYVYNISYTNIFGVETVENGYVLLIR